MVYESAYIVYYVVAAISALCSIYVASTLCIVGSLKTSATKLLLLLHVTLLAEELTSIPHIFNDNRGLCSFIAFFHFYSGLANAAAIGLLVVSYRYHFLEDTWEVMSFIDKYSRYMVGVFPLITLLPFITNSYSNDNQIWCTMETDSHVTNVWAFTVFYGWAWLILDISIAVLIHTMYVVYSVDREFGRKLFSTTGLYAIISLLAWIPRTAARFSNFGGKLDNTAFLYAYFPVYIAGICYTVVYIPYRSTSLVKKYTSVDPKYVAEGS